MLFPSTVQAAASSRASSQPTWLYCVILPSPYPSALTSFFRGSVAMGDPIKNLYFMPLLPWWHLLSEQRNSNNSNRNIKHSQSYTLGFPGGSDGKESACSVGDVGSIPGSGRSPGEGNGKESDMTEQLTHTHTIIYTKHQAPWKVKVRVAQSCPTLCDPMDSTVHGILQARILEQVAIPFFRGSSWPRDRTHISNTAGRFFTIWATREAQTLYKSFH